MTILEPRLLSQLTEATELSPTDIIYAVVDGNSRKVTIETLLANIQSLVTIAPDLEEDQLPDLLAWTQTRGLRVAAELSSTGSGHSESNEFGLIVEVDIPSTGAVDSYQKAAAIFIAYTADPSSYGPDITKDAVGGDRRGVVRGTILTGRAWGGVDWAEILSGGDGLLVGNEIDVKNGGTDQSAVDTSTSKYGLQVVSFINPMTAGVYFTGGDAFGGYHYGVYMDPFWLEAGGKFLNLNGAFSVDADGQIAFGGNLSFPAVQVQSADANTLDDYEEGTWTPVLSFATPGDLSVTYATQFGTYTKIGRLVTLTFAIVTSAFTHTTAAGQCQISGVPFTANNSTAWMGSIRWGGITKANYTDVYARVADVLVTIGASGSAQAQSLVTAADMPTGGTVVLIGTAQYEV